MKIRYYKWIYRVFGEIRFSDGHSLYRVLINGESTLLDSRHNELEVL